MGDARRKKLARNARLSGYTPKLMVIDDIVCGFDKKRNISYSDSERWKDLVLDDSGWDDCYTPSTNDIKEYYHGNIGRSRLDLRALLWSLTKPIFIVKDFLEKKRGHSK